MNRFKDTIPWLLFRIQDCLRGHIPYILIFLFAWALGVLGFEAARSENNLFDSGYRSLQLFGLNYTALDGGAIDRTALNQGTENWQIQLARYLAGFVLIWTLLKLLSMRLLYRLILYWQATKQADRRIVLIGFGAVNTALSRELTSNKVPVTAVSAAFTEADQAMAREHDILLVTGDLADIDVLRKARTGETRHIVVAAGDDVTNVELGTAVAGFAEAAQCNRTSASHSYACRPDGKPVVKIHLSSTRTLADLTEARDISYARGAAAEFFSMKSETAQKLVREARFTQRARDKGQDRVHIVLAGIGDQGEALLTEIYLNAFAANLKNGTADVLKAPRFTIIDIDPEDAAKARLTAHRPRLFDGSIPEDAKPQIEFICADALALCFESNPELSKLEDTCPVTAWIFTCGKDNVNLSAGFRLEMAMHQRKRDPAPIFIRLWSADIIAGADASDITFEKRNPLLITKVFGSVSTVMPQASFLGDLLPRGHDRRRGLEDQEHLAMLLHNQYNKEAEQLAALGAGSIPDPAAFNAEVDRYMIDWAKLPTNIMETNRRAIRHAAIKLTDMGFDWPQTGGGVLPAIQRDTATWLLDQVVPPKNNAGEPALPVLGTRGGDWLGAVGLEGDPAEDSTRREALRYLEAISQSEHSRWMADRAIDGWQKSERDNRRRLHPSMTDYGALDGIKALDMTAVRMLLDYLSQETLDYLSKASGHLERPQAAVRRSATISIEPGRVQIPTPEALADVTELQLSIGADGEDIGNLAPEGAGRLKQAVFHWYADNAAASRLHIKLAIPVEPDLHMAPQARVECLATVLGDIGAMAGDRVTIDVTRTYNRIT